ncbi:MAG TPA: hypothetical protein VF469_21805, partial [Kofleriaceae bacterium]
LRDPAARPARRVGATAFLVDGELAVWLEPKARRIATGDLPQESIELALAVGLPRVAARARRRELLIELIDGVPAAESPLARVLLAGTARADYRGLVVRAQTTSVAPLPPPLAPPNPSTQVPTVVKKPPTMLSSAPSDDLEGIDFEIDSDEAGALDAEADGGADP